MKRRLILPLASLLLCFGPMAATQQFWSGEIETLSANAEREARRIIAQDLYGHYDIVSLQVLNVEDVGRQLGRDYGLAKVTLEFSTRHLAQSEPEPNRVRGGRLHSGESSRMVLFALWRPDRARF